MHAESLYLFWSSQAAVDSRMIYMQRQGCFEKYEYYNTGYSTSAGPSPGRALRPGLTRARRYRSKLKSNLNYMNQEVKVCITLDDSFTWNGMSRCRLPRSTSKMLQPMKP